MAIRQQAAFAPARLHCLIFLAHPVFTRPRWRVRLDEASFAAIDFESAGSAPGRTDAPVQIGIARMEALTLQPQLALRTYLQTDRPVTWAARQVHGIRTEDLHDAPPIATLWPQIETHLRGRFIVAHSAATEKRFLRTFPTHRFGPWIDTLKIARRFHPRLPSHRLGDLIATFDIADEIQTACPGLAWHDALYDATASLVLLRHLIRSTGCQHQPVDLLLD